MSPDFVCVFSQATRDEALERSAAAASPPELLDVRCS